MTHSHSWWQTGVIYQIYPRSFLDSNGDGIGDLPGITSKLDYLRWLGVDALWLSPIYPSPMADFGYDITDYTNVHPLFGTLKDLDTFLHEAHQRDLKVILDFVPNHTSDEHPWFQQSRESRTNDKRGWYIWRDPADDGGPPNNWQSRFGGSAWTFDQPSGQYYLHLYDVKQPDLNWRNPQVRQAMYTNMRFWLERGVDGFRVDALEVLLKDEQFRDNPLNPAWKPGDPPRRRLIEHYIVDQPGMHDIMQEMRALTETYDQRVLIGELALPVERLMSYYGEQLDEIHLPFNFQFVHLPTWEAHAIRQTVEGYEAALPEGAWPNWVLGNHDMSRIATRVGREQARLTQMLLLTLRGTPICYYGEELGMQNITLAHEEMQDPLAREHPEYSRDPVRSPMQWDGSAHAGFSPAGMKPWLPVATDYQISNVAAEQQDPRSILMLTRALLAVRRSSDALTLGSYQSVEQESATCFVYQRQYVHQCCLVALNFSAQDQVVTLPSQRQGRILLSTHLDREGLIPLSAMHLRGNEGILLEVEA
ncbi:alpha-amylase [Dictyobacter sp. S3.2.2.5]|uniref:Alpha-amylase n=1 Tax=Dictyobacter halimunensis TaxID=3026934 RepID=A0ABQ6FH09_9CHLR|nr:alpha-amylase [Dictyobacter sp. S3.2.2.5]